MRLTKPSLQDLKKVSVMILCRGTESKKGSGTIVCVDDTLYVLTAAHVVSISKNKFYDKEKISITAVKGNKIYTFKVEKIESYDYNQDCAVLKVSNENSFPEEPLKQVRILKTVPNGEGVLCGFGNDEQEVKVYPFEQVGDTTWALHSFDVSSQPITAKENWGGFSGGGLFYKGEDGLYLSFYMKGLKEIEGNNNEFVCYPAMRFTNVAALQKLISNEKIVYVTDEGSMEDSIINNNFPHFLTSSPMKANSSNVIGRETDLQKLWEVLKDKKHVMLTGFGGIGKSKLAQLFFHRYENEFDEVAWIKYKGDLKSSFLACINVQQFNENNYRNEKDRWNDIESTMNNDKKSKLFIIDEVNNEGNQDPEQDGELLAITGWKNTTVLLTSRLTSLDVYNTFPLRFLEIDECINVFNHYYCGKAPNPEMVAKIVELSNRHTFTIELLAKGARQENLEEYYAILKDGFEKVDDKITILHHLGKDTIVQHMRVLYDIQKRTAKEKQVLNSFAILPDNCECTKDEIERWFGFKKYDLYSLIQDGWIVYVESKKVYFILPLVKTIVRFDFKEDSKRKRNIAPKGIVDRILGYMETHSELFDINKGFVSMRRMLDILESVISAVAISQEDSNYLATAYNNIGYCYGLLGDFKIGLEHIKKALQISESYLGKNHPDTAVIYNNVAEFYRVKGDNGRALKFYKKALDIIKLKKSEDDFNIAVIYNNMAGLYCAMDDDDKALEYYDKAMGINDKLGGDNALSSKIYNNMTVALNNKGESGKALEYAMRAKAVKMSILGETHPDLAAVNNSIGMSLVGTGDYSGAFEYFNKALELLLPKYGEIHPDTVKTYNNLGVVCSYLGENDRALYYYGKVLEIVAAKPDMEYPDIVKTYASIACVYEKEHDYDTALKYYIEELKAGLHNDMYQAETINCFFCLGNCYIVAGKEMPFMQWIKEQLNEEEWMTFLKLLKTIKDVVRNSKQ